MYYTVNPHLSLTNYGEGQLELLENCSYDFDDKRAITSILASKEAKWLKQRAKNELTISSLFMADWGLLFLHILSFSLQYMSRNGKKVLHEGG